MNDRDNDDHNDDHNDDDDDDELAKGARYRHSKQRVSDYNAVEFNLQRHTVSPACLSMSFRRCLWITALSFLKVTPSPGPYPLYAAYGSVFTRQPA